MYRKTNWKMHQLLYAVILALTVSVFATAQTSERVVDGKSSINQKSAAGFHHISGTVTMNSNKQPIAKANIELRSISRPGTGTQLFFIHTNTDEQGRWTIDKVPDDDYLITVNPTGLATGTKFVSQNREVKMAGADVDNVAFQVIKGGRITGKVVMGNGETLPERLIITPSQTIQSGRSQVKVAQVQPDASFVLEGVPTGEIILKAVVFAKPQAYFMKTATAGAVNLLSDPIRIEDGDEINDVYIVFAKVNDK
jgi:hypothetical protein